MSNIFIYTGLKNVELDYLVHQGMRIINRRVYLFDKRTKIYRGHLYVYNHISTKEIYLMSLANDMYCLDAPSENILTAELELHPAIDIDIFDHYGNLLINQQYYTRSGDTIKGPFVIEHNRNHQKFIDGIANDILYVAKKEQTEFKNININLLNKAS
jgi:hypothetical protein